MRARPHGPRSAGLKSAFSITREFSFVVLFSAKQKQAKAARQGDKGGFFALDYGLILLSFMFYIGLAPGRLGSRSPGGAWVVDRGGMPCWKGENCILLRGNVVSFEFGRETFAGGQRLSHPWRPRVSATPAKTNGELCLLWRRAWRQ